MKNAKIEVSGDKLIITVDLAGKTVPSNSGKMLMLVSTPGFETIHSNGDQDIRANIQIGVSS